MPRSKAGWRPPPPEIIRFIRSLAVADARRDHDAAIEAAQARRQDGPPLRAVGQGPRQR